MPSLSLRPLRPEDLDRVSDIESRVVGHPRKGFLSKRFSVLAAAPDSFLTCAATDGGNLAGYGIARLQEGEFGIRGAAAVLDVIGVDPEHQGKGIGKSVIAGIGEQMRKRGIGALRTRVDWGNKSMIGFFSSAGFLLAPYQVIERDTSPLVEEVAEVGPVKMDGKWRVHSGAGGDYYEKLSRDHVPVRSLGEGDLAAVVRIDGKHSGLDRSAYIGAKFREMLVESGIRVSLVAEDAGIVTGFIMARVDFGEFGNLEKAAEIDTVGVHPAYAGSGIGHALLSQLLLNLSTLKVESVLVQVSQENLGLQRFLYKHGFHQAQRLVLTRNIL
jgi:ribosomal protein S18 acetylase RimI-like enzyme